MKYNREKDLWKEGVYIDMWSLVHLLVGVVAGFAPVMLPVSFGLSLSIFFIVTVVWEVAEFLFKVHESKRNSIADVVIGVTGFSLTSLIVSFGYADPQLINSVFISTALAVALLSFMGWRAFKKRRQE